MRPENLPAAIVVQSHLATQWVNEYIEPFTELRPHIVKGTRPYDLPAADVFIFKYSNIAGWVDVAASGAFRTVIYDEIQELRRGNASDKGCAAAVFTAKADLRMGLSATPIYNFGDEIFHVMEFIVPGALGLPHDFYREWCSAGREVKNPDALGTYLREKHLMLRRLRTGAPINTITIEVPYDEKVEAEHASLARMLAVRVISGSFVQRGQAARELDMLMRKMTGLAKARHVAAYVRILLEAGEPVLLAGWHRDVYDIWLEDLAVFDPVLYTGSETPKQKDAAKAAFIEGRTNLMMISLRSGAGLDGLQKRSHTVVFGELDWSPKIHEQVIGRLDRPGQTEQVTAIFLHTGGGSDPLVINLLGLKASQAKGIVDPLSAPQRVHTDESRIRLLAEQFLARRKDIPPSAEMSEAAE
jgi:SNF2 family DNA or RNA helicase